MIQYALYRRAGQGTGPDAEAALKEALTALVRLRPENLVVLLQSGQRAIAAGDRAGATQAFLRVRELIESAPCSAATTVLGQVLAALESNDLAAARVPAIRLENVLKPTPPYQQGLRELAPGILGNPVERFAAEPPPASFGDPMAVRFKATPLAAGPVAGRALATGDFDGDGKPDLVWVTAGETPRLMLRKFTGGDPLAGPEAKGITGLLAADLDNDGKLDLIGFGPQRVAFWRGKGDGTFEDATVAAGLDKARAEAAAVLDYDIEGDLDLALGEPGVELFRNALQGPLEAVGKQTFPPLAPLRHSGAGGDRSRPRRRCSISSWLTPRGSPGSTTSARGASRTAPPPLLSAAAGEVIDRIVATVNGHIILQSDWNDALRYEALLSGRSLSLFSEEDRRSVLDRLIDQELLAEQMKSASFSHASESEAQAQIADARKQYPEAATDEGWQQILDRYGLTQSAVVSHVQQQIDLLRLVDAHLRPAVQIDSKSVEAYYRDKFVPQLKQSGVEDVPLADVSAKVESCLPNRK